MSTYAECFINIFFELQVRIFNDSTAIVATTASNFTYGISLINCNLTNLTIIPNPNTTFTFNANSSTATIPLNWTTSQS